MYHLICEKPTSTGSIVAVGEECRNKVTSDQKSVEIVNTRLIVDTSIELFRPPISFRTAPGSILEAEIITSTEGGPIAPGNPGLPGDPAGPGGPAGPFSPTGPFSPLMPSFPGGPASPMFPGGPSGPFSPGIPAIPGLPGRPGIPGAPESP
ncbi:hypothetical protein ANCDUO_06960 [Ancylostoma duodenale]|uniref:Collagen triple helix repeat protein n=1 Tax=Ancylostoma duodenale TaxID=51022 RepID=A0A0C2D094_9BILA|nr:hypothetical protein ANCDUO_06960 [Ancylostoma duodenale]